MASTQVPIEQSAPETTPTLPTASANVTTPQTELETLALESLAKLDTLITLAGQVFQALDVYSRRKLVNEDNEGEFGQMASENFGMGESGISEDVNREEGGVDALTVESVVERYRETEAELKELVGRVDALKSTTNSDSHSNLKLIDQNRNNNQHGRVE
ncbi:8212_t:CDS:2 [Ambispora leptoticha]|uniref:8212_t:CDS:1 n=1 Tax=Ambispora leptoticha TaxID=144679 RepID=A0A9N9A9V7_9GLOM|nr:8212_t:CDS:2 [Ambispora leptoticha]